MTLLEYDKANDAYLNLLPVMWNGKWGILNISTMGEVLPFKWDYIDIINRTGIIVQLDGKYGVFNEDGKEIVPCEFENISIKCNFIKVYRDGKYALFDKAGKMIVPYGEYYDIYISSYKIIVVCPKGGGCNILYTEDGTRIKNS